MPNARIKNTTANAGIRNWSPNVRSTHATFNTTTTGGGGSGGGSPIGLLLALTYSSGGTTVTNSSDYKPNARIR